MRQGYSHSVRLTTLMLRAIAQFCLGMAVTLSFTSPAWAETGTEKAENQKQPSLQNLDKDAVNNLSHADRNNLKLISIPKILQLSEIEHSNTSAQMLLGQSPATPNTPSQGVVQITGVKANPSDRGVEVILQTSQGQQLQLVNRSARNSFITDIPNAQLRLPNGDAFTFRSEKPLTGITEITVTNFDANTIRVTVTGEAGVPTVELFDSPNEGLIFSVASATSPTQQEQATSETQPQQPAAQQDEPIELVVTGEQDGYRVPNATTATRTDTPLRDIPQSIQVVPRQVLEDRNVTNLTEALETVSGVIPIQLLGLPAGASYIRGFEQPQQFRNGYRDNADRYGLTGIGTIEQVEVLKGPASVLFGAVEPGGIVNVVTKQPLSEPFYKLAFEAGNRAFDQPSLDFSGPLNADKTLLYRFNVSYQSSDSFQEFVTKNLLTIAPTITWKLGDQTTLNLYYEYLEFSGALDSYHFLTSDGTKPSRNRFLGYPNIAFDDKTTQRYGYTLTHEFSDNWQIRNNFSAVNSDTKEVFTNPTNLSNNHNLSLTAFDSEFTQDSYFAQADVLGKFKTGSISHQLLVGFDFNHSKGTYEYSRATIPDLDVFNPNYDIPKPNFPERVPFPFSTIERYGVYLQDQITFLDNLKLLIGGRLDWISQEVENTSEQNDFAFSPRVGLVYQPSESVSLYTSYSKSFNPTSGFSQDGSTFEPTKGTQYEAGIKADFLDGKLSTTLAAYQITKTNVTTPDLRNPPFSTQTGEQRSRGIELDITGEILPGWKVTAGYAYTNAEVTEDNVITVGNRLQNVPKNQASLWTTYFIQEGGLKGLGFGLGLFYVGNRQGDLANTFEVGDYLRTDAAIYYRRDRFNAAINIRNLFDTDYFGVSDGDRIYVRRGAPFTIIGSISWEF